MKTPRRYIEKNDLQPNQGWLNLHENGFFGYNLASASRLSDMQDQINDVEDRVRSIVGIPVNFAKMTAQQIQELVLAHLPVVLQDQVRAALRGELAGARPRIDQKN